MFKLVKIFAGAILAYVLFKMSYENIFSTPTSLGKECCECWKDAKEIKNITKRLRENEACYRLTRNNMESLQEMGVDKDWTSEKVESAQKEFDRAYEACK